MSDIKFQSAKNDSPHKFVETETAVAGVGFLAGLGGALFGGKARRKAKRDEKRARREMMRLQGIYQNLDTSNPFVNVQNRMVGLENTMEDLTVNQQQAQFERDQFQQSQANILGDLRGAAGGSGIAALAQSLAKQGQIAAQRSSASIGAQEAANQKAAAATAGRLQEMEARGQSRVDEMRAQGEQQSQQMEMQKQGTLLGMAQQRVAAAQQAQQAAGQSMWSSIGSMAQGAMGLFGGGSE